MNDTYSDFLYARPSFFEGAARIIDMGNTLSEYNSSNTEREADAVALWMDWIAVGQAIRQAIGEFNQEADRLETVGRIND